jgi:hypothetical protein
VAFEKYVGRFFRRFTRLLVIVQLAVVGQRPHRQYRLHERRMARRRILVAVPAAVRPLPMQKPFDKVVRALIGDAQLQYRPERVRLL